MGEPLETCHGDSPQLSTPSAITLHLARNPGIAAGDQSRGYVLTAPLTKDGMIDSAAFGGRRWAVHRFGDERDGDIGWLARRGSAWFIDYDSAASTDDEPIFRLSDHPFLVGEYVTITGKDHRSLTYRVSEVTPLN